MRSASSTRGCDTPILAKSPQLLAEATKILPPLSLHLFDVAVEQHCGHRLPNVAVWACLRPPPVVARRRLSDLTAEERRWPWGARHHRASGSQLWWGPGRAGRHRRCCHESLRVELLGKAEGGGGQEASLAARDSSEMMGHSRAEEAAWRMRMEALMAVVVEWGGWGQGVHRHNVSSSMVDGKRREEVEEGYSTDMWSNGLIYFYLHNLLIHCHAVDHSLCHGGKTTFEIALGLFRRFFIDQGTI